jgi:hypothetical protein
MATRIEVKLVGEFTTVDVFLEGNEIPLKEVKDNEFYKVYTNFQIDGPLDVLVRLKGFYSMDWDIKILANGNEVFHRSGVFDDKEFVTFKAEIDLVV